MQMVEAGELSPYDPAADHLPPDLDFDTNGATIRQLLGQRSGIPEYGLDAGHRLETERCQASAGATVKDQPDPVSRISRSSVKDQVTPEHPASPETRHLFVETSGLEPPTPCLQSRCSTS